MLDAQCGRWQRQWWGDQEATSCSNTNGHVNCLCLWQLVHVLASVTLLKCLDSMPGQRVGISNPGTLCSQRCLSLHLLIHHDNSTPSSRGAAILCATFIKIEQKLIKSIITHQLLARDLYKLQRQHMSKEDLREVSLYKNPGAILHPLHIYFAILNEYLNYSAIALIFFRYLNHLQDLINVYEWPIVLEYHQSYFDHRVFDMHTSGDYRSWGLPEYKLMNQLGFTQHCMPTPEIAVPTQQLKVLGYREEPLLPITWGPQVHKLIFHSQYLSQIYCEADEGSLWWLQRIER